jgi:hypothetical protein
MVYARRGGEKVNATQVDPNHLRAAFLPAHAFSARHRRQTAGNTTIHKCKCVQPCCHHIPNPRMSTGYFPKREKVGLEDLFSGLVTASHILHHHGIFDAYGHVSVRSPDNSSTFWMPCNMPPALVSSAEDLVEYKVDSAEAVEKNAKPGYLERHIHSEIYKRFPTVNAVVHSHSSDVLPYTVSGVPLRSTIHMAGFLGMLSGA